MVEQRPALASWDACDIAGFLEEYLEEFAESFEGICDTREDAERRAHELIQVLRDIANS